MLYKPHSFLKSRHKVTNSEIFFTACYIFEYLMHSLVSVCLLIVFVLYTVARLPSSEETWMQPSGRVKKPYPSISCTPVKSTAATGESEACRSLLAQTGAPLGSSS